MPTTNHTSRKKPNLSNENTNSVPWNLLLAATAESTTMTTMPSMSSRMSTDMTFTAKWRVMRPKSLNALYIMVVDDMANIPPTNIQLIVDHPSK